MIITKRPPRTKVVITCNIGLFLDCLIDVFKHEGVRGLWRGVVASVLLVFNPSIQFTIYEALKRHYLFFTESEVRKKDSFEKYFQLVFRRSLAQWPFYWEPWPNLLLPL